MGDQTSTSIAKHTGRSTSATGSAEVAVALADPTANPLPRTSQAQRGHSLAEMAELDLDAALQLLAERAQYITGASGAAIALRRGPHNDMLCRASVGSSAPGLGALLSMEHGLSGESVRHRKTLHCDDTERDSRVSRDACRRLGIASVVIMPIVCEEQAVGVLEVFSGTRHAFAERDFTALQRLSGLVETAVKHAVISRQMMAANAPASPAPAPASEAIIAEQIRSASYKTPRSEDTAAAPEQTIAAAATAPAEIQDRKPERINGQTAVKWQKAGNAAGAEKVWRQPLYWSIALQVPRQESVRKAAASISIPETLRNLQKCQACGFPVSPGRSLCVECEEKQWRGLPVRRAQAEQRFGQESVEEKRAAEQPSSGRHGEVQEILTGTSPAPENLQSTSAISIRPTEPARPEPSSIQPGSTHGDSLFLSTTARSDSWLAANKYILIPLLLVATAIAAVIVMR